MKNPSGPQVAPKWPSPQNQMSIGYWGSKPEQNSCSQMSLGLGGKDDRSFKPKREPMGNQPNAVRFSQFPPPWRGLGGGFVSLKPTPNPSQEGKPEYLTEQD
jgi:hypothetical protein